MKTFVFGDLHCKIDILEKNLKTADKLNVDKIVFVGDACDEWGAVQEDNVKILTKLIETKKELGDKFIWLLGNHDWAYFDDTLNISGHIHEKSERIYQLLTDSANLWDLFYSDGRAIYSHAGLSQDFYNSLKREELPGLSPDCTDEDIKLLNTLKTNVGFASKWNNVGPYSGGYSAAPSPLWVRPKEFTKPVAGKWQIVGHTPVRTITIYEDIKLVVCDTYSLYPSKDPIGDRSALLIDDSKENFLDCLCQINADGTEAKREF